MSDPSLPKVIGGKYRPLRLLGKGGMGAVYEVEHLHTGQRLALKILTPQPGASVERFKRESRAASNLRSDHIVRITDADVAPELDSAPFLVMELLEGSDLEAATRSRPASPPEVLEWLRQIARGLSKAHEAGIVHRDLKPENLFLTRREDGSPLVKILDFGIAKLSHETTALTASDALLGTPAYMAPEQTDSRGLPITPRTDLYALGLIAFRLLTGRMYWREGSLAQLMAQILAEPMPPASERGSTRGRAFDAWFERACNRDPDRRFASVKELVEALAVALELPADTRLSSDPAGYRPAPHSGDAQGSASLNASFTDLSLARKRTARRRLFGGGIAVGVVAVLGVVVALVRGGGATDLAGSALRSPMAGPAPSAQPPPPAAIATIPSAMPASETKLPASPLDAAAPSAPASSAKRKEPGKVPAPRASTSAETKPHDPLEGPW